MQYMELVEQNRKKAREEAQAPATDTQAISFKIIAKQDSPELWNGETAIEPPTKPPRKASRKTTEVATTEVEPVKEVIMEEAE